MYHVQLGEWLSIVVMVYIAAIALDNLSRLILGGNIKLQKTMP
jgi:hypothetical protein